MAHLKSIKKNNPINLTKIHAIRPTDGTSTLENTASNIHTAQTVEG